MIVTKANLLFVLIGKASGSRNLSFLVQVLFPVSLAVTIVIDVVMVLELWVFIELVLPVLLVKSGLSLAATIGVDVVIVLEV